MGKFSDFDLPQQKYNFHRDLKFGKQGEQLVQSFLEALSEGSFEVKTDRYRNGKMVVEMEHCPRREKWEPSGLSVTKARWWVYVYTLDGSFVIVSVPRLRRFIDVNKYGPDDYHDFAKASSNPSRGLLLTPTQVTDLMIQPEYDEVRT
jgi:hypothetical protein